MIRNDEAPVVTSLRRSVIVSVISELLNKIANILDVINETSNKLLKLNKARDKGPLEEGG